MLYRPSVMLVCLWLLSAGLAGCRPPDPVPPPDPQVTSEAEAGGAAVPAGAAKAVGTTEKGEQGTGDGAGAAGDRAPGIRFRTNLAGKSPGDDVRAVVEVFGLKPEWVERLNALELDAEQWTELLAVYVARDEGSLPEAATGDSAADDANRLDQVPMFGSYRVEEGRLLFEPRFALERGVRYVAVFRPAALARLLGGETQEAGAAVRLLGEKLVADWTLPGGDTEPSTEVAAVYPSAEELPENQLKFYLHFSAPMSRGQAYERIHLLDEAGQVVRGVFLELDEELWDRAQRRFTLLLDPGRIKRGLRSREEFGPALEEGKSFTLVVDQAWEDAEGKRLVAGFRKTFRVGPPDDKPPTPADWEISSPAGGTTEPLVVRFGEPLDHALLGRLLTVVDPKGNPVMGSDVIDQQETRWQWRPETPWQAGRHVLRVDGRLEDRAGNSVGRKFEVDVFDQSQPAVREEVEIPFEVRPAKADAAVRSHGGSTAPAPGERLEPDHGVSATFSIVAADPETGICGAAVASKYPAVGEVVPYARGGVGAFCTQHWHHPGWGEKALDLLADGMLPEAVLAELLRDDPRRDKRQLAIIDAKGRAANRNPAQADPSGVYWGAMSGRYYACQGNTLTGREVVVAMAKAYEETEGSLADRLMAALVAADCAGGDHRGRLAAGIRVARPETPGYWLELQVDKSDDAVIELARRYAELEHEAKGPWPGGRLPLKHPCPERAPPRAPEESPR